MRATRRLDHLVKAQAETVGLAPAGRPKKIGVDDTPISRPVTLAEAVLDSVAAYSRIISKEILLGNGSASKILGAEGKATNL